MSLLSDAKSMLKKDPAARSLAEVMLLYPGFHALIFYRISHWLFRHKRFFLARTVSQWGRGFTGIEIHPGAQIGDGLFIDHGAGIVVGKPPRSATMSPSITALRLAAPARMRASGTPPCAITC